MTRTSAGPILLQFLGGAGNVTGSMVLVRGASHTFLLECGLFQGPRQEARRVNSLFPFVPRDMEFLLLSRAHLDHSGTIPTLVKQGFTGKIYATSATADLASVMLQIEDAEYLNRKLGLGGRGNSETPLRARGCAGLSAKLRKPAISGADEDRSLPFLHLGFQVKGTLGRRIVEGAREVRILEGQYPVRARVEMMRNFSAHADRQDLLNYVASCGKGIRGIFLVHGEPDQAQGLAQGLADMGYQNVHRPGRGDSFLLED